MGWYYEDFEVGTTFETASRQIDRKAILEFARLTGDDNPLHTDPAFMRETPHGDVIAHGLFIQSVAIGLIATLGMMDGTTIALAEVRCRFLLPVLPGDDVRVSMTIESKRESRKPDRGVLVRAVVILNQRDEVVAESTLVSVMRRRPTESV